MNRFHFVNWMSIVLLTLVLVFVPWSHKAVAEFPEYRVVIDPGHGGVYVEPVDKTGDRYDIMSGKYLDIFREGSAYKGIEEHIIMYQIGIKVKEILDKTETQEGFEQFARIVSKYSETPLKRVIIKTYMSRTDSPKRDELLARKDPNDGYRLFDYPGENGEMAKGRLSYINSKRPHLVLSLHCAQVTSRDRVGMNAVISPSYDFYYKGLEILQKKKNDKSFFYKSPYADWFEENSHRSLYRWFLSDSFMYFSGYYLNNKDQVDHMRFKGYARNMVQWAYADAKGWDTVAKNHPDGTSFASTINGLVLDGRYWDRERSAYEGYRRDGGPEGYGGDNFYSANEILRYALWSVNKSGYSHKDLRIAPPYISAWIVPLYVNAISAYVELGYIKMPSYRHVLTDMQDSVAEGIAVGIYSLFTGLDTGKSSSRYHPKGTKLDLDRYMLENGSTYFDAVVQ
jgi:N-acetylmuramoyl-L-alanine amidase